MGIVKIAYIPTIPKDRGQSFVSRLQWSMNQMSSNIIDSNQHVQFGGS